MAPPVADAHRGNLIRRVVSAMVLAPLVLLVVYVGTVYFNVMVALMVVVLAWEWGRLCAGLGRAWRPRTIGGSGKAQCRCKLLRERMNSARAERHCEE